MAIDRLMRSTFRSTILLMLCVGLSSCLIPVVFEGISMSPAIEDGDRLLFSTTVGTIERGDIIQFQYPKDPEKFYAKRVVGLPGETVEIKDGSVFINGARIEEAYVKPTNNEGKQSFPPTVVPPGHYFVLGDNRDNSSDSRYWGPVDHGLVEGKLYWRYASGSK